MKKIYVRCFSLLILLSALTDAQAINAWTQRANFGGDARHRATGIAIGNRGYMGLGHVNSVVDILYNDWWEYDPGSDSWMQKANFAGGLRYHATGFTIGNKGYVGMGRMPGGTYSTDMWEYDPTTNVWTAKANFIGIPRRGAVSFVVDNIAYVGTGQSTSGFTNTFHSFNPVTNTWGTIASLPAAGRTSSVAFSIGSFGYVGTGQVSCGINDFWRYDPSSNTWLARATVPGPVQRQEATAFAVAGKGYIGTGDNCQSGTNYKDMWEYDPTTDTWVAAPEFEGIARRYLVSFVIGDKAYSGTGTNGTNFRDFWVFDHTLYMLEKDQELVQVRTYPNPATDQVRVDLKNLPKDLQQGRLQLQLTDLKGGIVYQSQVLSDHVIIPRNSLPASTYLLTVMYEGTQLIRSSKIIFQ